MNLYESRAITRARQSLSVMINEALLDNDLSLSDLSALSGIDVDRLQRAMTGMPVSRGELKFVEIIHLFDVLQHELVMELDNKVVPEPIAKLVDAAKEKVRAAVKADMEEEQIYMFPEIESSRAV